MSLDVQLKARMESIPGCIGAGYIDLGSGMPLAVVSQVPMDEEARNLLAVAAVQVMSSSSVSEIGQALELVDDASTPPFRETIILTPKAIHVFERMKNYPTEAVFLIFEPDIPPDQAIKSARKSLSQLSLAGIV